MKQNQVLYVSPCSERSGAEQLTKLFILNHSADWAPSIVFLREGGFVEELRNLGIRCFVLPKNIHLRLRNPKSLYQGIRFLSELMISEKIDLVHSVMGYGHLIGGMAAHQAKRPEVWYQHGPTGPLDYLTGRVPSRCTFTNSRFTESCQKKFHARSSKIKIIYPAVADSFPDLSPTKARTHFGIATGDHVFGLVGRVSPMKGQLEFIDAALKLLSTHPDSRFLLIGSSFENHQTDYADRVQEKIKNSPWADRFISTGFLPNPQNAMEACDVIVNATTTAEPFGLTLIEAMQLGKTVLAPAQGGPLEIIDSEKDGFFFDPKNSNSLHAQMRKLIEIKKNSQDWQNIHQAAKYKVSSKFGLRRMMSELETEYQIAIGERA